MENTQEWDQALKEFLRLKERDRIAGETKPQTALTPEEFTFTYDKTGKSISSQSTGEQSGGTQEKPKHKDNLIKSILQSIIDLFGSSQSALPVLSEDDLRIMLDNAQQRKLSQSKSNISALEDSWQ